MADQSTKNLETAFAGESQANRRYLAWAVKADEEGKPNIARLFRAVAGAETIHAHNHLKAMGGVGSTLENLESALQGETEEITGMYPMFMDQAKRDAANEALKTFYWANEAEETHAQLYRKAVEAARGGGDAELGDLYICEVCGYTVEGSPPDKCPTCQEGRDKFARVD
jgi:rubrerythrin